MCTVEPRNSVLQNSGKPRISAKFSNAQIFIFDLLNLQNSGNPRNSGNFLDDQTFRYCGVLLYIEKFIQPQKKGFFKTHLNFMIYLYRTIDFIFPLKYKNFADINEQACSAI